LTEKLADTLWIKAHHDYNAAKKILDSDPKIIGDHIVGFLLQQSVEKAIRSLLLKKKLKYAHIHDISLLLDTLSSKIAIPPGFDRLRELTVYALIEDESPLPSHKLDRQLFLNLARDFLALLEGTT
jgi:HEPN domain-containing protein